jgi:hypothetical protein
MRYPDKLRAFAEYLDAHPVVAERAGDYDYPSFYIYCENWDEFQEIIKHLDGFEKAAYSGNLTAKHRELDEDGHLIFHVGVNVSGVCEAKPKVDEEGNPVMRPKTKVINTDELEQVMEYDCPKVWTDK